MLSMIIYSIFSIHKAIDFIAHYFSQVNGPIHSLRMSEGSTIATANRYGAVSI